MDREVAEFNGIVPQRIAREFPRHETANGPKNRHGAGKFAGNRAIDNRASAELPETKARNEAMSLSFTNYDSEIPRIDVKAVKDWEYRQQ